MKVALVGAPNCGKSTLFNRLTRAFVPTGNRAGVTVEATTGHLRHAPQVLITDLPGIYSTEPRTNDEQITWRSLTENPPDMVLFVADGTRLARSMPLLETLCARFPVVLAVNMWDELRREGRAFSPAELSAELGIPVFPISAKKGEGVAKLSAYLAKATPPRACARCGKCKACATTAVWQKEADRPAHGVRAERLFLHPFWGFVCLLAFFALVLYVAFGKIGNAFCDGFLTLTVTPLQALVARMSFLPPFWQGFLSDGILGGVGAVLGFLPRLFLVFLLLATMEDSGYLARACALCHRPLRFFGLHGESAVPLLLGVGCSVSGVLATRHMEEERSRRRVVLLVPFVCCSARLPVLAAISTLFFASPAVGVLIAVGAGVVLLLLIAFFASFRAKTTPLATELPRFRLPSVQNICRVALRRSGHFLRHAGGVICLFSIVLWLASHLSPSLLPVGNSEESLAALVGGWLAKLFVPLGFGNWQCATALLVGVGAKEALFSTLAVFCQGDLRTLTQLLSPAAALSFLVFFACYCPCAATLAALKREGGMRHVLLAVGISLTGAYLMAFLVYRVALLFAI